MNQWNGTNADPFVAELHDFLELCKLEGEVAQEKVESLRLDIQTCVFSSVLPGEARVNHAAVEKEGVDGGGALSATITQQALPLIDELLHQQREMTSVLDKALQSYSSLSQQAQLDRLKWQDAQHLSNTDELVELVDALTAKNDTLSSQIAELQGNIGQLQELKRIADELEEESLAHVKLLQEDLDLKSGRIAEIESQLVQCRQRMTEAEKRRVQQLQLISDQKQQIESLSRHQMTAETVQELATLRARLTSAQIQAESASLEVKWHQALRDAQNLESQLLANFTQTWTAQSQSQSSGDLPPMAKQYIHFCGALNRTQSLCSIMLMRMERSFSVKATRMRRFINTILRKLQIVSRFVATCADHESIFHLLTALDYASFENVLIEIFSGVKMFDTDDFGGGPYLEYAQKLSEKLGQKCEGMINPWTSSYSLLEKIESLLLDIELCNTIIAQPHLSESRTLFDAFQVALATLKGLLVRLGSSVKSSADANKVLTLTKEISLHWRVGETLMEISAATFGMEPSKSLASKNDDVLSSVILSCTIHGPLVMLHLTEEVETLVQMLQSPNFRIGELSLPTDPLPDMLRLILGEARPTDDNMKVELSCAELDALRAQLTEKGESVNQLQMKLELLSSRHDKERSLRTQSVNNYHQLLNDFQTLQQENVELRAQSQRLFDGYQGDASRSPVGERISPSKSLAKSFSANQQNNGSPLARKSSAGRVNSQSPSSSPSGSDTCSENREGSFLPEDPKAVEKRYQDALLFFKSAAHRVRHAELRQAFTASMIQNTCNQRLMQWKERKERRLRLAGAGFRQSWVEDGIAAITRFRLPELITCSLPHDSKGIADGQEKSWKAQSISAMKLTSSSPFREHVLQEEWVIGALEAHAKANMEHHFPVIGSNHR